MHRPFVRERGVGAGIGDGYGLAQRADGGGRAEGARGALVASAEHPLA